MIINIERPLYEKTMFTEYLNEILSYDTEKRSYSIKFVGKTIVREVQTPLDVNRLSFSESGPWSFDPEIIEYLYELGIDNLNNIPDLFMNVLINRKSPDEAYQAYKKLLYKLLQIRSGLVPIEILPVDQDLVEEGERIYDIIKDDEDGTFDTLCTNALIYVSKPNWVIIAELKKFGFRVFPLEADSFGWLIGGVDTGKGIISFG